jgi:succinyl-CoA synthetase beta subunit
MARLHEHEGKAILARARVRVPRGGVARSAEEARSLAASLGVPVVVKIQAWTTGRAGLGGVAFADSPAAAAEAASRMLGMKIGQFPVESVLVEERLKVDGELFISLSIDEAARAPVLLISEGGGSGVEERAAAVRRILCDVESGPPEAELGAAVSGLRLAAAIREQVGEFCRRLFEVARSVEARSVEVNPVAVVGAVLVAADCRMTVDDYAVFRHPELGIEIARELDHPPTTLERIAYRVEQEDHRGTFFFAQLNTAAPEGSPDLIGFHGAGGGGSMMSMDAITAEGFTLANFCDTSGNPSPAKVYRAARIILSQPGLVGYFGSGSGVANQEQFWSAYGLAKAFWEMDLDIPAVIRLGGNTEDRAVDILEGACRAAGLRARVEGYRKTDPPAKIAARFAELVRGGGGGQGEPGRGRAVWQPRPPRRPVFVGSPGAVQLAIKGGRVWLDPAAWKKNAPAIVARSGGLLRDDQGRPASTLPPEHLAPRDSDFIACEVECRRAGVEGVFVELDVPGLDAATEAR